MNSLLVCFANNRENPLPELSSEDDAVYNSLTKVQSEELYILRDSFIHTEKLSDYLVEQREKLWLLHYGGHADGRGLGLEDKTAQGEGIAQLLAHCKNLKLVVLNGCATEGQVQRLLDVGVPAVIATSAPVGDSRARRFAEVFYKKLSEGLELEESFELAKGAVNLEYEGSTWYRGFVRDRVKSQQSSATWGLFFQKESEAVLRSRLPGFSDPRVYFSYTREENGPSESIVEQLYQSLQKEGGFYTLHWYEDLSFGEVKSTYQKELGEGELVVVFLSDEYLRSEDRMFELYELGRNCKWDKTEFSLKVLPVRIDNLALDDPDVLDSYFDHWEKTEAKWKDFIQRRSPNLAQMAHYNKIREISRHFGDLADWLMDIHASSVELLSGRDFAEVKRAVERGLKERK